MKRFFLLCLVAFTVVVSGFFLRATSQPVQPGMSNPTALFQSVRSSLGRGQIPLRLPTYIPNQGALPTESGYTPPPVYAVLDETSNDQGYTVILGYTPDCTGGNACRLGTVTGKLKPSQSIESEFADISQWEGHKSQEPMSPVRLSSGINGWFIPWVCGANCSDAQIVWDEYAYRYSVGIKVGDRASLERMANSAIEAARR